MNVRLVCKLLGIVALLIGGTMLFSLPWAFPRLGQRHALDPAPTAEFETAGFFALLASVFVAVAVGVLLLRAGRHAPGQLFRKEAMAVVGLSWILATALGALPYSLSGTRRSPAIRLMGADQPIYLVDKPWPLRRWQIRPPLADLEYRTLATLIEAGSAGLREDQLDARVAAPEGQSATRALRALLQRDPLYSGYLQRTVEVEDEVRRTRFRARWTPMNLADALFESQSGFSTTGATVIANLEDPGLVPHCILFWRSSSHFLGGLGIIVLFVAILGHGSAGKALMRVEVPGPSKEGSQARMQHTAWVFAGMYCALNAILTGVLMLLGLSVFDALCHAFGTMATGGFSTYNASVGHFDNPLLEYTIILFMGLAGTNFTLLYFFFLRAKPGLLLRDPEWRAYIGIIVAVTLTVVVLGHFVGDFTQEGGRSDFPTAMRNGLFQVVSVITTTGYGTHDFDSWNSFGRGVLLLLMFIGGCAGSTGGGMKVIRWVLLVKIMGLELEHAYRPSVVRPLRLGGKGIDNPDLGKNILVYFGLIMLVFALSWLFVVGVEPDSTWGGVPEHKLVDSASAVAATLNNIGPGLGVVGAKQNYAFFSWPSKLLFTWLMMLGRVELFAIIVLGIPSFWRSR